MAKPWKLERQMTMTVRVSDLSFDCFSNWLETLPIQPRTANEALNWALQTLTTAPANALLHEALRLSDEVSHLVSQTRETTERIEAFGQQATPQDTARQTGAVLSQDEIEKLRSLIE